MAPSLTQMSGTLFLLLSSFVAHLCEGVVRRAAHNFLNIQVFGVEPTSRRVECLWTMSVHSFFIKSSRSPNSIQDIRRQHLNQEIQGSEMSLRWKALCLRPRSGTSVIQRVSCLNSRRQNRPPVPGHQESICNIDSAAVPCLLLG